MVPSGEFSPVSPISLSWYSPQKEPSSSMRMSVDQAPAPLKKLHSMPSNMAKSGRVASAKAQEQKTRDRMMMIAVVFFMIKGRSFPSPAG